MKKLQRLICLLLSVMMVCSLLSACSSSSSSSSDDADDTSDDDTTTTVDTSEYPDLTDAETEALEAGIIDLSGDGLIITDSEAFEETYGNITMLIVNSASRTVDVADLEICSMWYEDTGITFDWTSIPEESATEKINLMLASGDDLPDAFWNFGDGLSSNTVVQYADQDVFMPTEDMINDYMPNLKEILDESDSYWQEITAPDGHTYGFPYIEEMYGLVLTPGPLMINGDWLEQVGLDNPETVDEWVEAMIAFRDAEDLNGNGEDDEIPIATWFGADDTFGSYNMFYRFTGAFGCADSYCGGNSYADHLRIIDGEVTFTALDDAFLLTADFFNMLYEEDLIWEGSFEADESATYTASLIQEDVARIGCFGIWTDQQVTDLDVHDQYIAVNRLEGDYGYIGFENNYSELQDSSNTAITTSCEFPHVIAKFVDYMVGDPAVSVLSNWGPGNYEEDEDGILRTTLDDDGNYVSTDESLGTDFGTVRVNTTTCRGSMIVLDEYYETVCGYTYDAVQLLEMQYENGKTEIMEEYESIPKVMMTTDEVTRLAQIQPTISDIVNRYIVTWVTEGTSDESWEAYQEELYAAGVEEVVEIYQTAVDRVSE